MIALTDITGPHGSQWEAKAAVPHRVAVSAEFVCQCGKIATLGNCTRIRCPQSSVMRMEIPQAPELEMYVTGDMKCLRKIVLFISVFFLAQWLENDGHAAVV